MRLSELLTPSLIRPELSATNRDDAIRELAALLTSNHPDLNEREVVQVVLEREELASTGIGEGVAIPHGSLSTTDQLLGAMGRSRPGIEFHSVDGAPAHLIFLLLVPRSKPGVHLKTLANITKVLKNGGYRNRLLSAGGANDVVSILEEAEQGFL